MGVSSQYREQSSPEEGLRSARSDVCGVALALRRRLCTVSGVAWFHWRVLEACGSQEWRHHCTRCDFAVQAGFTVNPVLREGSSAAAVRTVAECLQHVFLPGVDVPGQRQDLASGREWLQVPTQQPRGPEVLAAVARHFISRLASMQAASSSPRERGEAT